MIRVLLADDQPQVRSALRLLLEHEPAMQVVGEAANVEELLDCAQTVKPDLILLDWELPGLSQVNLLPMLHARCPSLSVIALSAQLEAYQMAIDAGVDAFVNKAEPPEHLLSILRNIMKNGGIFRMKQELVKEWMTPDVITISPETTLPEAHRLMTEKRIRRLPVVKNGKLIGIVTLGDVREAEPSDATTLSIWELNYLLAQLQVEKIMTSNPLTISEEATIGEAAQVMLDKKISGLPVVNSQGKIVGIITESDIFRTVVKRWSMVPVAV
jgi:CBS domain-containing protein